MPKGLLWKWNSGKGWSSWWGLDAPAKIIPNFDFNKRNASNWGVYDFAFDYELYKERFAVEIRNT